MAPQLFPKRGGSLPVSQPHTLGSPGASALSPRDSPPEPSPPRLVGFRGCRLGSLHPESCPDTPGDAPGDVPGRLSGVTGRSSRGLLGLQRGCLPRARGWPPSHSGLGVQFARPASPLLPTLAAVCSVAPMLSCFSRVRLCATPYTAAHQALPSLGFSRQEYWSGLPFPFPMHGSSPSSQLKAQGC